MLRSAFTSSMRLPSFTRSISNTTSNGVKRFMQTAPSATNEITFVPDQPVQTQNSQASSSTSSGRSWSRLGMPSSRSFKDVLKTTSSPKSPESITQTETGQKLETKAEQTVETKVAAQPKKRVRRTLKPRKALITLTPNAMTHLQGLLNQPIPQMIRIGVKNRGCSGLTYNLEYIETPGKFDEIVEQNGVKVVIDSKALFSIVGSEMDWLDDKLSSRFVFRNPNSKGTCGCGESFMV